MTPLEQLTKKIQAHVPDLMKLSFGCRVKQIDEYTIIGGINQSLHVLRDDGKVFDNLLIGPNWEILGHPITLEHVLKAMNVSDKKGEEERHTKYKGSNSPFWSINSYGVFMQIQYPGTKAEGIYYSPTAWKIGLPLSEQSEDTIKWLNQIIV